MPPVRTRGSGRRGCCDVVSALPRGRSPEPGRCRLRPVAAGSWPGAGDTGCNTRRTRPRLAAGAAAWRLQTSARPSSTAVVWASAQEIEGDQAHRSERCQGRSRIVSAGSAGLRWHLTYCVAPGGCTFAQTLDHGGLDLCTPMFAPCLLACPSTGRQDPVLTSLRLAGLRYSSVCHSIPATQVFKKVPLSSELLICGFGVRVPGGAHF